VAERISVRRAGEAHGERAVPDAPAIVAAREDAHGLRSSCARYDARGGARYDARGGARYDACGGAPGPAPTERDGTRLPLRRVHDTRRLLRRVLEETHLVRVLALRRLVAAAREGGKGGMRRIPHGLRGQCGRRSPCRECISEAYTLKSLSHLGTFGGLEYLAALGRTVSRGRLVGAVAAVAHAVVHA